MGRIDEMLERARTLARKKLPPCFELVGVDLAFGPGDRDAFVVDIAYRRANALLEPWGWEAGLLRQIRGSYPRDVWIGFHEVFDPEARDIGHLDGTWIILDEE